MGPLKATVHNGRLVLNEPTELPEGTVVELVTTDWDDLDDKERAKLHAALENAAMEAKAGLGRPAEEFLKEL